MWSNQSWLNILYILLKLFVQSFTELRHQSCAASHNDLAIQGTTQINITFLNAGRHHIMDSWELKSNQLRPKQNLRCLPFLHSQLNCLTVWKYKVSLLELNISLCGFLFKLIKSAFLLCINWFNIAVLFFHAFNNFEFRCCLETIP